MDKIDMHVHTTASDGTMRPVHVVSLAAMQGLKAIAITDHDTMDGIAEAGKAGELMGKRHGLFKDTISVQGAIPIVIDGGDSLED